MACITRACCESILYQIKLPVNFRELYCITTISLEGGDHVAYGELPLLSNSGRAAVISLSFHSTCSIVNGPGVLRKVSF